MRCFVAIEIDEERREAVRRAVDEVRPMTTVSRARISWARPEGWHVTLKFLGDVAESRVEAVRAALASAVRGVGCFELLLRGLAGWPRGSRARVLAVGVEDDGNSARLARGVDDALEPLGFARETRDYTPHLTVARLRDGAAVRAIVRATAPFEETLFGTMPVERMGLYESVLGPDGAKYRRLEEYALAFQ
jgi:2'-5' RNA ligase